VLPLTPKRIAMWLLGAIIVTACVMGLVGAAICYRLEKIPCEMPGLQQFGSDALAALLGLIAGSAGREDK
jgi:hypothetical protein